jgi:SagB-type dehydrogenase family enzyme
LQAPREVLSLELDTIPLSQREVEYPAMLEMHEASSLASEGEVAQWRERGKQPALSTPFPASEAIRLAPLPKEERPTDTIEQVILRRGSTRTFDRAASITLSEFSTILESATPGIRADFLADGAQLNDVYLIAHAVRGLAPGAYFFRRERKTLELLKPGEFRGEAGRLGLEQELPADACVDVFFLADLNRILDVYGNRGYRAVQLEAGAIGGKMYLAAYALRLGASGLTFFDDEVVEFFSPDAKGMSAIFLLAIGKALKRKTR